MYFSKLDLEPDAAAAADAERLARKAIADARRTYEIALDRKDPKKLAKLLDKLAKRHARRPYKPEKRALLAQTFGSLLGEIVRARAGGEWGIGRLFTEQVPGGLLVGRNAIKFWPWQEVRDRIEGRAAQPLEERIANLCERAAAKKKPRKAQDDELPRLYPLKADEGYFDAGVTRDDRQVLMAAFYSSTFAIFFSKAGTFEMYTERANSKLHENKEDTDELRRWQKELGFKPKTIHVRKFSIPGRGLGIEELTGIDEALLADPESEPDPQERAARLESLRNWIDHGYFVLYWGNDLWLDGTGHVTSS